MMNYFLSNLIIILQLLIGFYIYVLLIRLILQKLMANYYNPVVQNIVRLTNFLVKPLRRILPYFKGYDLACVFIIVIFQIISIFLGLLVSYFSMPNALGFVLALIGELGRKVIHIYVAAIIIQSVISWFTQLALNPASQLVCLMCEPIMRRVHRLIPAVGGIDLSPILILIGLYILNSIVFYPLIYYGYGLR